MIAKLIRILTIATVFVGVTVQADAQKVFGLNRFVDSVLMVRYHRANIDTNYVIRPQTKWTLIGRGNISGSRIKAKGHGNGRSFESELTADYKTTLSVGVSYLGLGHFPEGIITTRAAVVKQIGSNKFAGLSTAYNFTSIGYEDNLVVRNQKWFTRVYFGFRL